MTSGQYESEFISVNGEMFKRHSKGEVDYHSLCGTVKVQRYIYRKSGVRNGPTVVPLDVMSQIVERSTPALAYRAALGDAQCPGRQWEEQLRASHRRPPSRSTLERIAKRIGNAAKEAAPQILQVVRADEPLHEEAISLSIGLDRTTIPMEEKLRWVDMPPERKRKKPYVRRKPASVAVNYRMAYVGTICLTGPNGESLQTYRYGCSADEDPVKVINEMMADTLNIQKQRKKNDMPPLPMGIIQDGAPEMWNLVEAAVRKAFPGEHFDKAIDRYHLMERLAESFKAIRDFSVTREIQMKEWSEALDKDDDAIRRIEKHLLTEKKRQEQRKTISRANAEILRIHLTYIANNKHLMRYASVRNKGLPTGSGATEGACKSLIMIRTKGCGQRWHSSGVNSVLTLRSLYQNERLKTFWNAMCEQKSLCVKAA